MNIGVIGNGFVGKATKILSCKDINFLIYDIKPELCEPKGLKINDLVKCDIIFISVPTPMDKDGSCYLGIIENVIENLKKYINFDKNIIVLRSTIPPGTTDKFNCFFMPEFLTEKNYEKDFINNENWIFGLKNNKYAKQNEKFKQKINKLINYSYENKKINYNNIYFVENKEAEMIKLFRNNFLALKVSFCNEINEFCKIKNINYNIVRKLAILDKRIGESHSMVPGHDGKFGFGGTCFPKDNHNLEYEMKKVGMKSYIINSMMNRNNNVDRKEKDWILDKGRTNI